MLVYVVATSYPSQPDDPSGHFVHAEVEELRAEGKHVVVLTPEVGGAFGWPGVLARLKEHPKRIWEVAQWTTRTRRELRRRIPDKVVAHWAIPCGWPIAHGLDVPVEIVSHGADVRLLVALPSIIRNFIVGRLLRDRSTWRFVSDSLRDQLGGVLPIKLKEALYEQSVVRPSPITFPEVREEIVRKRASVGARRLLVCVARLVPSKRVDRAIAFANAQGAKNECPPVLVVVGDGPERKRLEHLATTLGVDARFVGKVGRADSLAWIGAADTLLHASATEGLSTVVREAEALGVSVTHLTQS